MGFYQQDMARVLHLCFQHFGKKLWLFSYHNRKHFRATIGRACSVGAAVSYEGNEMEELNKCL